MQLALNATWTPLYIVRGDKRPLDFLFNWKVPMFGQGHLGNDSFTTLTENDRILGTQPWCTLALLTFGVVGQFLRMWYSYDAEMREQEDRLLEGRRR